MPGTVVVNPSQGKNSTNVTATSGSGAAQTITIPAKVGLRIVIRGIVLYSSAAGTPTVVVQDNAATVTDYGTQSTTAAGTLLQVPASGIASANQNQAMQVVVGLIAVQTTTVSVIADYVDA